MFIGNIYIFFSNPYQVFEFPSIGFQSPMIDFLARRNLIERLLLADQFEVSLSIGSH